MNFIFIATILVGIFIQILGLVCLAYFKVKGVPTLQTNAPLPGVSILKTCYKASDNEEVNFDVLFHQDYPGAIEILFVVSDEKDPIVPLIREYISRYPKTDAHLLVSKTRKAFWKKVDALYDGHQNAKYDVLIWSDSDVILKPNYVSQMVACLQEPGVSVVTTPQYDARSNNFPSALKTLGNNCDVATSVMIMNFFVAYKKVGFGQSIGFRKSEFDSFGEKRWNMINTFLADDQALPYLFYSHGRKVVFRDVYCPVQYSDKTLTDVVQQKYRWLIPQKMAIGNRYIYCFGWITYPVVVSFLFMCIEEFSPLSASLFLAACFSRILVSFIFEASVIGGIGMSLRYFWTIPLWDLMQFFFFPIGFFKNTMEFGNRKFKVVNRYFLEEILPSSTIKHELPNRVREG